MSIDSPILSLVVATRGRAAPFDELFDSLERQTARAFEVIIIDQNADDRIGDVTKAGWMFPITHVRTPHDTGLSRARNVGIAHARASIVLFPDDDCWYPPHFLAHALSRMNALRADVLSGRAAAEDGRDINGRFEAAVTRIQRSNVFTTGIEWVVFFKREVLETVGGYDPDIGVGASTPWQSCEGQDIMLRSLDQGFSCIFDPTLYGHHAELDIRDPSMLRKGRSYARGLGYVLRLHRYSTMTAASWIARPIVRAAIALVTGDRQLFAYYRNVALGRIEGWRMKAIAPNATRSSSSVRSAPAAG